MAGCSRIETVVVGRGECAGGGALRGGLLECHTAVKGLGLMINRRHVSEHNCVAFQGQIWVVGGKLVDDGYGG